MSVKRGDGGNPWRCPARSDGKCVAQAAVEARDTAPIRLWADVCEEMWRPTAPLDATWE